MRVTSIKTYLLPEERQELINIFNEIFSAEFCNCYDFETLCDLISVIDGSYDDYKKYLNYNNHEAQRIKPLLIRAIEILDIAKKEQDENLKIALNEKTSYIL